MMGNRIKWVFVTAVLLLHLPVLAQDEDLPSDDFLEYLATLVDQDGEWIDPLELDELPDDELDVKAKNLPVENNSQYAEEAP